MALNKKKMTAKQVREARKKLGHTNPVFADEVGAKLRTVVHWQKNGASQLGSNAIRYVLLMDNAQMTVQP